MTTNPTLVPSGPTHRAVDELLRRGWERQQIARAMGHADGRLRVGPSQIDADRAEKITALLDATPPPPDRDWMLDAACRGMDPALFHPVTRGRPSSTRVDQAVAVCARCTVRDRCLDYAETTGETRGVWGGLTARQRADRRRSRP